MFMATAELARSALDGVAGAGLPAVLVTGDTSPVSRDLPWDPHRRIARKPLNAEDLLILLHELLAVDASAAGPSPASDACGFPLWREHARDE